MTLGRLLFIIALFFSIMGGVILFPAVLNQERRADPEYRTEKMDLKLEQYFGKEAVSAGIKKIDDEQYNQKKITYWISTLHNEVTFQKEYKEISKNGHVISNAKSISQKLPAPPKRWYSPESMILKNGELEVEFKKIIISGAIEGVGGIMLIFAAIYAFVGIILSLASSYAKHPTTK